MEDFGFDRSEAKDKFFFFSKKILFISGALFSIACFIFITLSSYNYFYNDKNSNIEIIKADEKDLKSFKNAGTKKDDEYAKQIDRAIYEDIFGAKNPHLKAEEENKIKQNSKPALPPKKAEKDVTINLAQEKNSAKAVKKIKKPISRKSRSRTVRVQIAAMTSKESANKAWDRFSDKYPDLFSNLSPHIQEVDLGKRGLFYRLQAGEFFDQIEAEKFCEKYIKESQKTKSDCIIVE